MIFTQENPLASPRRPSNTPIAEPISLEPSTDPFVAYLEDSYKVKRNSESSSTRNSFCSQVSYNSESTSSSFSSSMYLSQCLNSFRNSPPHNNLLSSSSVIPENYVDMKVPPVQTAEPELVVNDKKESQTHKNERILLENTGINTPERLDITSHVDYFFANDGMIAYLPDKLALIMKEAIYLFNLKPASAKEFLLSKKVLSTVPSDFAEFIFTYSSGQSKLSKRRIGEFVGNSNPYNQEVLNCFLAKFDFTNMALDEAIRSLVRQFRLPGEAQQIDRILEKFATIYFAQNGESSGKTGSSSTAIKSADVAYILSFSTLMLNTDLHNPSVPLKNKMTITEFIRNNRGINGGLDIPSEHLEGLYMRIKNEEIKMDMADMLESDVPAFMAPIIAGYLLKLYHVAMVPMWKKRWFILNDGCLYYFNKPYETKPKCIMPLENIRIEVQSSTITMPSGVNVGLENRKMSSGNLHDVSGSKGRRVKGRVSFMDNLGLDSSSNNECVLIVYGAASSGLLKSSKLSKKGGMTLAPRSRLVLRASSVSERDEWLAALQVDKQSFDPLKNTAGCPSSAPEKWASKANESQIIMLAKSKGDADKSANSTPKSRYDVESSSIGCSDHSFLEALKYNRRLSGDSNSNHSEAEEGSLNSARSFVSWGSDYSASGDIALPLSLARSLSPEPSRAGSCVGVTGGASGNNSNNNSSNNINTGSSTKWVHPFGSTFQRQKNVSWPYGSPKSGEFPLNTAKIVDISTPDAMGATRVSPSRKHSSSSIMSYASGLSSTHSTHSAHSDETVSFGMSEILLEGFIYRYAVQGKLEASDPTGFPPRLKSRDGLDAPPSTPIGIGIATLTNPGTGIGIGTNKGPIVGTGRGADSPRERGVESLETPVRNILASRVGNNSAPDLTASIQSTPSSQYNKTLTRHSLSSARLGPKEEKSTGSRRRNYSVSSLPSAPPLSRHNDHVPLSDILTVARAVRLALGDLLVNSEKSEAELETSLGIEEGTGTGIGTHECVALMPRRISETAAKYSNEVSKTGTPSSLEIAIPTSEYTLRNMFEEFAGCKGGKLEGPDTAVTASDYTEDSTYTVELDRARDLLEDLDAAAFAASVHEVSDAPVCAPVCGAMSVDCSDVIMEVGDVGVCGPDTAAVRVEADAAPLTRKHSNACGMSKTFSLDADDIPDAGSPAISPATLKVARRPSNVALGAPLLGAVYAGIGNGLKTVMDYGDDSEEEGSVRIKKVASPKSRSVWGSSALRGSDEEVSISPSFVSPKRLSLYAESSGVCVARRSSVLEKDCRTIGSSSSGSGSRSGSGKMNSLVPALSFAGIRGVKSMDLLHTPCPCPVGVDISVGAMAMGLGGAGHGQVMVGSGSGSKVKHPTSSNGLRDTTKWKRMYLTLYSDTDGKGDILFYFPNEEAAQCLRSTGVQTQQGYLRMRSVLSVEISSDEKVSSINVFTRSEILTFALMRPADDIYKWVQVLRESAENSSDK